MLSAVTAGPPAAARRVLVARLDNLGDVLLSGPAVRAVAASGAEVHYLCSPQGRPAAVSLPGVARVLTARAPWIDADPRPATRTGMDHLIETLADPEADEALILTSFHQSPLPLALLMRMAGIERVAAISVDYPGSLLDIRHLVPEDIHEVERALSLVEAAGHHLPPGDDGRLRIAPPHASDDIAAAAGDPGYVVVHPGASVPARAWDPARHSQLVAALVSRGHRVVLTGGDGERPMTARVAAGMPVPGRVVDLAGRTDFQTLSAVVAAASVVVCGNTGPAHLAAAVGTPVVSIYAPTVPAVRWRPWMVPHVLLGRQDIGCAGCRARVCPVAGHPCVSGVPVGDVVDAVEALAGRGDAPAPGPGAHRPGAGTCTGIRAGHRAPMEVVR